MFRNEDGLHGGEWRSKYGVSGGGFRGVKSRAVYAGTVSAVGRLHLLVFCKCVGCIRLQLFSGVNGRNILPEVAGEELNFASLFRNESRVLLLIINELFEKKRSLLISRSK